MGPENISLLMWWSDVAWCTIPKGGCLVIGPNDQGHMVATIFLSWAIHVGMILMNRRLNRIFIAYHTASIANALPWNESVGGR